MGLPRHDQVLIINTGIVFFTFYYTLPTRKHLINTNLLKIMIFSMSIIFFFMRIHQLSLLYIKFKFSKRINALNYIYKSFVWISLLKITDNIKNSNYNKNSDTSLGHNRGLFLGTRWLHIPFLLFWDKGISLHKSSTQPFYKNCA